MCGILVVRLLYLSLDYDIMRINVFIDAQKSIARWYIHTMLSGTPVLSVLSQTRLNPCCEQYIYQRKRTVRQEIHSRSQLYISIQHRA